MTDHDPLADPWAWASADRDDETPDLTGFDVAALVVGAPRGVTIPGAEVTVRLSGTELAHAAKEAVAALPEDIGWLWFLTGDTTVTETTLPAMLAYLAAHPDVDVAGPTVLHPQRRGAAALVASQGYTVSRTGRLVDLVDAGELFQGQLRTHAALGLAFEGLLVRRTVFDELGGFAEGLGQDFLGVELGWLANLAGHKVQALGNVRVQRPPDPDLTRAELTENRVDGLALAAAHYGGRLRLALLGLLRTLGLMLGKAFAPAMAELSATASMVFRPKVARGLRARRKAAGERDLKGLLPSRWHGLSAGWDAVASRLSEWWSEFAPGSGAATPGFDDLTGGDFAATGRQARRRLSPAVVGGLALVVVAFAASRGLLGSGSLSGPELLPAPSSWSSLWASGTDPVVGQPGIGGAPWTLVLAVLSFVTLGNPSWLITAVTILSVPLAWLAGLRFLGQLTPERRVALAGASVYALVPILTGVLSRGQLGTLVWVLVLPLLGYALLLWRDTPRRRWRYAARVALFLTLASLVVPATWPLAVLAIVALAVRHKELRLPALLAIVGPLLVVVPSWGATVVRFPGRLLTGTDPALAPLDVPTVWQLPLGISPGGYLPPLWLSAVCFGLLWAAGVLALLRTRRGPVVAMLAALAMLAGAIAVTRLTVWVAPGVEVRPQAEPWLILMAAALVIGGVLGAEGLLDELAGRSAGVGQLLSLLAVVAVAASVLLGAGWWVVDGNSGLTRAPSANLPAFVRNAANSGTVRVLVLHDGTPVTWTVISTDVARLGDPERILGAGGSLQPLADSVARRLVAGTADETLVTDLRALGVGYVWAQSATDALRTSIGNTPGIGTGTGDETNGWVWPVPGAGRAMLVAGDSRTAVAQGGAVAAGDATRTIVLAEPEDPRWTVTLDGRSLTPAGDGQYGIGMQSGQLRWALAGQPPWGAWLGMAALLLLALWAAPGVQQREAAPVNPRRSQQASEAARRSIGGAA